MDFITVTAKTVDDAVTKAAIELEVPSDQLEYDVIEKGSAGFLGLFGGKDAVIRARRSEAAEKDRKEFSSSIMSDRTGRNAGKDKKPYHNKFTFYFRGKPGINSKGEMSTCYGYTPGYCTLFVCYCLVKIGLGKYVPFDKLNSKANGYWWHAPSLMKYYKSKGWLVTSAKKAEVGAIAFKGKKSPTHTCIFVKYENGYVYTWDGNVAGGVTYNKRKASVFCGFANLPYKAYFGVGAKGVDVLEWQKYLNWDFGYGGTKVVAEDSDFGKFTEAYTKEFQKAAGLTADGTVGYQTVAKAKAVRK